MIFSERECFDLLQRPDNRARWDRFQIPEPMSGCWLWLGAVSARGHGQFFLTDNKGKRGIIGAHRAGWMINVGRIPDGLLVCHRCDNPGCVNWEHHFLGTHADNSADMVRKRRHRLPDSVGEKNPAATLNERDVALIRSSRRPVAELADMFSVTKTCIHECQVGATWRHLPGARSPKKKTVISPDAREAIRNSKDPLGLVAKRHGVSPQTVIKIRGPISRPEAGRKVSASRLAIFRTAIP